MDIDQTSDAPFIGFIPGQKQEDDHNLLVEFFVDKKLMGKKTEENGGRPVYEDREYVRIYVKGQKHQIVVDEVRESHKMRFPIAYQRFLMKKPAPVIGTPIELMPNVGPSLAGELKLLGLRTVEDLARITDDNVVQTIGHGARALIRQAQAFLERTSGENVELQQQNAQLRGELTALNKRLAALEKVPRQRKTRRSKRSRRAKPEVQTEAT
jgi:hypothetical protein